MRFHDLEAMPYAEKFGRQLRKGRAISPVVAGTRTNSHLVTECFRLEGAAVLQSMDWFKGNLQENPIFNGKIYGFL